MMHKDSRIMMRNAIFRAIFALTRWHSSFPVFQFLIFPIPVP